jgi:hypothetical protein
MILVESVLQPTTKSLRVLLTLFYVRFDIILLSKYQDMSGFGKPDPNLTNLENQVIVTFLL